MSQESRTRLKQWLESGEARLFPMSFPQRELWEATPLPPGDVANHICAFIEVRGPIASTNAAPSLQRVVDRHDALRLSFLPGKKQDVQMVRASREANLPHRELPAAQREGEGLEEAMREIFLRPFDMVQGPLYHTELLQRGRQDLVMVLSIHHAIADGWSLGVFVQDLLSSYLLGMQDASARLPPVPQSHGAWAEAERAHWTPRLLEERASFWKKQLGGARQMWQPEPVKAAGPLCRSVFEISPALTEAVRGVARSTGATLFCTLLTAFQWTLFRWTGKDDITVGTPVANRTRPSTRETMGYFAGNVPLRAQVEMDKTFAAALREGHSAVVDAFANAMPFAELALALGDSPAPGHHPVYDVRFALQNHPVPDVSMASLSLKLRMRSTGTARFDLGCEITEEGAGLEVVWLYRPSLFSRADIDTLNGLFQSVLTKVCDSPERRASFLLP